MSIITTLGIIARNHIQRSRQASVEMRRPWWWIEVTYLLAQARHGYDWVEWTVTRADHLNSKGRSRVLTAYRYERLLKRFNPPAHRHLTKDKVQFLSLMQGLLGGRSWFDPTVHDADALATWLQAHPQALVKARNDTWGRGIYQVPDDADVKELHARLLRDKAYVEELIQQHPSMAAVSSTVNTVRIHTLTDRQGHIHVMRPYVRFGRGVGIVDNLHAGGLMYPVDLEHGIISEMGFDSDYARHLIHPGIQRSIVGMQIPYWPEVKALVVEAAQRLPQLRLIGWDVAITPQGPCLVEGNEEANHKMFELIGEPRYQYRILKSMI